MGARDIPDDFPRASALVASLWSEFFKPPANQTVSQWADQNRMLSGKASSEPGPWRTDRTPYLRQIMDDLSARSTVQEVVVMFGAQLGKSESGNNWLGYIIDNEPGPVMCVQPTTDMAKRFSRQRILPMLEETPVLRKKVRENRSRDDANTTLMKDFAGGVLVISGANSAASLRSMPVRYLFLDEIDAYPLDVDGEGDPVALAEKRTSTFARKKVLKVSTPTTKDFSRIEAAFLQSDANYFHIACPHCQARQSLIWGTGQPHGLRWDKTEDGAPRLDTIRYVCKENGCEILEHHKPKMLSEGVWVSSKESTRVGKLTGYHLNALYAPLGWTSWADLVQQFTEASHAAKHGDVSKLKTFTNTVLAETWEEQGDKVQHHELARRAEAYPLGAVPMGGLMLVAGVDVQPDRLECRVWAFGRGEESWLVDRHIIYGDANQDEQVEGSPWAKLTEIRRTAVPHASGRSMMIESVGVDSGGHNTQAVYHYCRSHAHAHVLALKGSSQPNRPVIGKPSAVDVNWRGKTQPRSLKLWLVGVDTAKHLIYGRLRMHQPGPGYIHLPEALKAGDEFEQLTAERLATKYIKGHAKLEWFKPAGKRNEALDCAVYAYAMACYLGAQSMREPAWAKREERIAPKEPDLFAMASAPAANQSADAGKPIKNHIEQPPDMVKQPNPYLNRPRQKGPSRQW
jgi:phage terminase large subunit GpA-like protein